MGRSTRPSEQRLNTILARQDPPGWGADYVPGQLATRDEAPSDSRPETIWSEAYQRELHAMSRPEAEAILVGLHLGRPVELNEGRMLWCEPGVRRLIEHPLAAELPVRQLRGTVAIAETLGVLHFHPRVSVENPEDPGRKMAVPFPYLGDLLWLFKDARGHYLSNWTVKATPEEFETSSFRRRKRPKNLDEAIAKEKARHAIEELYYRDGGVPTVRVAGVDIPRDVANNLRQIYGWHARNVPFDADRRREIVDLFRGRMTMGIPPIDTLLQLARSGPAPMHAYQAVLYQAIWRREIRVDLWEPVLPDVPLRPETRDPQVHFAAWFARGVE